MNSPRVERGVDAVRKIVSVPNISCNHCANAIKRELAEIEGITSVEVDLASKKVAIEWGDPPARWENVLRVLREIGYPAEET